MVKRHRRMQQPEPHPERRPGAAEQGEGRRVEQREHLAIGEVDEEPDDAGTIGVRREQRAEHQPQVQARQAAELGHDQHGGQQDRGKHAEHRPASPIHQTPLPQYMVTHAIRQSLSLPVRRSAPGGRSQKPAGAVSTSDSSMKHVNPLLESPQTYGNQIGDSGAGRSHQ